MLRAFCASSTDPFVSLIISVCANLKMFRIDAGRIVALVANT